MVTFKLLSSQRPRHINEEELSTSRELERLAPQPEPKELETSHGRYYKERKK